MSRITTKIYVGNLPETCRRQDLQETFEDFGKVVECDIVKNYAFVHFQDPDQAKMAVDALDNTEYQGSTISVQLSHSKVRQRPGMGGSRESCFKCGKPGHWSKDCRMSDDGFRGGRGGGGGYYENRRGGGGGRSYTERMNEPYMESQSSYGRERSSMGGRRDMAGPYAEMYERKLAERRLILMREMQRLSAPAPATRDPYARPPPDYYRRNTSSTGGRPQQMDMQRRVPQSGDRFQRGNY